MKKLILITILILTGCTSNEEEIDCNCVVQIYQRYYPNSNSFEDTFITERNDDGCYTEEEATANFWFNQDRYSTIICDTYL